MHVIGLQVEVGVPEKNPHKYGGKLHSERPLVSYWIQSQDVVAVKQK